MSALVHTLLTGVVVVPIALLWVRAFDNNTYGCDLPSLAIARALRRKSRRP